MNYVSPPLMPYTRMMATGLGQDQSEDWLAGRSIIAYGVRIGIRTNRTEFLDQILDYAPPLWKRTSVPSVERMFSFRFGAGSSKSHGASHTLLDSLETTLKSRSLKTILEVFQARL